MELARGPLGGKMRETFFLCVCVCDGNLPLFTHAETALPWQHFSSPLSLFTFFPFWSALLLLPRGKRVATFWSDSSGPGKKMGGPEFPKSGEVVVFLQYFLLPNRMEKYMEIFNLSRIM